MLRKTYRLSSVGLKGPRMVKSNLIDVKTAESNLNYPRFGFVISKKLDKRAVARNTIKRKLSASIEGIFDRIKGGRDFVFYPKREILEIEQNRLNQEIEKIFIKEGFLNA